MNKLSSPPKFYLTPLSQYAHNRLGTRPKKGVVVKNDSLSGAARISLLRLLQRHPDDEEPKRRRKRKRKNKKEYHLQRQQSHFFACRQESARCFLPRPDYRRRFSSVLFDYSCDYRLLFFCKSGTPGKRRSPEGEFCCECTA